MNIYVCFIILFSYFAWYRFYDIDLHILYHDTQALSNTTKPGRASAEKVSQTFSAKQSYCLQRHKAEASFGRGAVNHIYFFFLPLLNKLYLVEWMNLVYWEVCPLLLSTMHCIETSELWLYTAQQKLHTRLLEQNLTDEHVCKSARMPHLENGCLPLTVRALIFTAQHCGLNTGMLSTFEKVRNEQSWFTKNNIMHIILLFNY